jgi:hypothetical protein
MRNGDRHPSSRATTGGSPSDPAQPAAPCSPRASSSPVRWLAPPGYGDRERHPGGDAHSAHRATLGQPEKRAIEVRLCRHRSALSGTLGIGREHSLGIRDPSTKTTAQLCQRSAVGANTDVDSHASPLDAAMRTGFSRIHSEHTANLQRLLCAPSRQKIKQKGQVSI